MIENKVLLVTATEPSKLLEIFNERKEVITKVTIISIDFPPLEILYYGQESKNENILGKSEDNEAGLYETAGVIIDVVPITEINNGNNTKSRKIFVVASDVLYIKNNNKKTISINGEFTIIPEELISKVYTNFPELKSVNLKELEDVLNISNDDTAIKAFNKLGKYFSASNYENNNNIFSLIEHQEQAKVVAKRVLLKKMVAWELRK